MIVGLEICGDTVRAVRQGRPRAAGAAQSIALPIDAGRVPVERLAGALGARNPVWGVAVPSSWCLYRTISLPYSAPGRVAATFRYALEGRLPGSVEEYCIDALSELRPAGEKGCRLTVAACPKEKVRDLVAQLKEVGAHPCVVQPALLALARRLRSAVPNGLILRIGQEVELGVMQQGELVAADVFPLLPDEGPGAPGDAAALLERVRFALNAMELSWGHFSIERCVLIVPDSMRETLSSALAGALNIPVEPPPEEVGGPEFAVAWGIAAQAADKAHLAPSLLQGEFAHPAHAQRYERRAAVALAMVIGIVLLLGIWSVRQFLVVRASERADQRREQELYRQVLPAAQGVPSLDRMKAELARIEKQGAGASDRVSIIGGWMELLRLTPPEIALESIEINTKRIALRARSKDRAKAWELQAALRKSALLVPSQPGEIRTTEGGATTFSMEVRYR